MKLWIRNTLALAAVVLMAAMVMPWSAALAAGPCDLLLTPASQSVTVGDTFTVSVVLQPNGQQVVGVDSFVNFDPAHLQVTQLVGASGSPFGYELHNAFDNTAGHADYSVGTLTPPSTGSIALATITFKAIAATTSTALTFNVDGPRTTLISYDGVSVLRNAVGANVAVSGGLPSAAFAANATSGVWPLAVNFSDTSTGGPTAWAWTFGDGGSSMMQNPTHVYTAAGSYNVALTVTISGAQYSLTRTGYITVVDPTPTPAPTQTPTPAPGATPTGAPPPTVISPPPPVATRMPIPVPGTGGNDFGALLPWIALAAGVLVVGGVFMRGRARRGS